MEPLFIGKRAEDIAREAVSLRHCQLMERKYKAEKKLKELNRQIADCSEYLNKNSQPEVICQ